MGKVVEPVVNVNEVSRVSSGTIIRGDIYSPNDIRIDGSFEGRIISKDTLSLKSSSVIEGDLKCRRLEIEMDARFDGNCQTINEEEFNTLAESMEMV